MFVWVHNNYGRNALIPIFFLAELRNYGRLCGDMWEYRLITCRPISYASYHPVVGQLHSALHGWRLEPCVQVFHCLVTHPLSLALACSPTYEILGNKLVADWTMKDSDACGTHSAQRIIVENARTAGRHAQTPFA